MAGANTLIGEDYVVPDNPMEPVQAGNAAIGATDLNVSRGVAALLILAVATIALIRFAGLQAMIAVGRGKG